MAKRTETQGLEEAGKKEKEIKITYSHLISNKELREISMKGQDWWYNRSEKLLQTFFVFLKKRLAAVVAFIRE